MTGDETGIRAPAGPEPAARQARAGSAPTLNWGIGSYESLAAQLLPAARAVVESAGLRPDERVLDLGCGNWKG